MSSTYTIFLVWQNDLVKEAREVRKFVKDYTKGTAKKAWNVTFDLVDFCIDAEPGPPRGGATPQELLAKSPGNVALTLLIAQPSAGKLSIEQQAAAGELFSIASANASEFHETRWLLHDLDTAADIGKQIAAAPAGQMTLPAAFAAQVPAGCAGFGDLEDFKNTLRDVVTTALSSGKKPWLAASDEAASATAGDALEASRREKMAKIVALGHDPWGQRFDGQMPIADVRAQESQLQETEHGLRGGKVRIAGRIVLQRSSGKVRFIDISDRTGRLQVVIGQQQVGEANWELAQQFDLGDIVGVDGELGKTKRGELSIFAEKLTFLTKAIDPPPEKHHGINDPETRQRMRYLDLAYNEGVLERFVNRTKIVASIRDTLNRDGYIEIEGPTLHSIAGGAAARPFITHHNTLDMELFMRIALELHLKRLLVGGMERVYELGRVYRNEGISPKHNPEFTMLEVYQAYGDYRTMMDLTENIICNALKAIGGGQAGKWGEREINFAAPFQRETYANLFAKHTGVDPEDETAVIRLAEEIGFETAGKHPDVIRNEIFEEKVEDQLMGPIFVMDYPASICPLTKRKNDQPHIAERFELYIQGMEVANAYTELNDPDLQEQLFKTQLAGMAEEDSMAKMDHDFIRALRQGMPPAGGLGIGIDRLVMLLTNTQTIREVILFPLLREEK